LAALCSWFALSCAPALAAPTVVSLGFDDGHADQWAARDVLNAHGMRATFFINSGRPGKPRFMTLTQLRQLQADGHEIGGHTIDHVDVPTLGPDEQRREICNDRAALIARGFQVTSFAFPFGSHDDASEAIVESCGYTSGRITSGVQSPHGCDGCPMAESLVPRNRYATRTPESIRLSTTLDDMKTYVDQAVAAGGGWVQIVVHHVCDGCNRDSVSTAQLGAFLDYVAGRAPDGVEVKTVAEVIGQPLRPVVRGPDLPGADGPTNLLRNPSLDDDANDDGVADCWQHGATGRSLASWTRLDTEPHAGRAAESVLIAALAAKADRKLVSRQDTGTCAPTPQAGRRYRMTWWFRATDDVRPVAYVRTEERAWRFWAQGPVAHPGEAWRQASWTTPRVPAGVTAISVGVSLRAVGRMDVDDLLLQDTRTPLPAPAHADQTAVEDTRTAIQVPAGPLPLLVYGAVPGQDLPAAQAALQAHLKTLRRAGFTPVGAAALQRVRAGLGAGVARPALIAFRGAALDSIAIAARLLDRESARAVLVAPAGGLSLPTLRGLAPAPRWDVVAGTSSAGRALRGRLALAGRAVRIPMTFETTTTSLVRALRAAAPAPRSAR
jgi:hypothetical protein